MLFRKSRSKEESAINAAARVSHHGPSILTGDLAIDGQLVSGGELQVDGIVRGHVRAQVVVVGLQGEVYGELTAANIIIRGRVIGPVYGVNVTIVAGGQVEGDVQTDNIAIEPGAYVNGRLLHFDKSSSCLTVETSPK